MQTQNYNLGPQANGLFSLEAEECAIGCALINPDSYEEMYFLSERDFHLHKHRWLWSVISQFKAQQAAIDIVTVANELERRNLLNQIGGPAYIMQVVNSVPTSLHAETYARIVQRDSKRRRLVELAAEAMKLAHAEDMDIDRTLEEHIKAVMALTTSADDFEHISSVMDRLFTKVSAAIDNPSTVNGLKTGLYDLDAAVDMTPGELIVMPGEPGVGKTILALQLAETWATNKHPGAVFEMELKSLQVARRMLSNSSEIHVRDLRRGSVADAKIPLMIDALSRLSKLDVFISEATHWNTTSMRGALTRLKRERGIEWFIVDYFDLVKDYDRDKNERDKLAARAFKDICKDLNLLGLIVHTLNKTGEASGSNHIKYAADNVLNLEQDAHNPGKVRLSPWKIRDDANYGPIGLVKIDGYPRFGSVAKL